MQYTAVENICAIHISIMFFYFKFNVLIFYIWNCIINAWIYIVDVLNFLFDEDKKVLSDIFASCINLFLYQWKRNSKYSCKPSTKLSRLNNSKYNSNLNKLLYFVIYFIFNSKILIKYQFIKTWEYYLENNVSKFDSEKWYIGCDVMKKNRKTYF